MAPPPGVARQTLTSPARIDRLFKQGRRSSHALLLLIAQPSDDAEDGKVLFVAGKKLGGAVLRNRSKRVLREACRRAGGPWPGLDIALVARAGTAQASPDRLDSALSELLARVRATTR